MTENEKKKKPKKIDMAEILGPDSQGATESGEIELLDPGTGAPMQPAHARAQESARGDMTGTSDELSAALAEREKYYDLWVRARADFENFKKRMDREREEERAQAGASLVRDMLPVVDNLERALAGSPAGEPFHDGVALICRQLQDCLSRAGLTPIEALGTTFNPVYHEAVTTERTDRFEPNKVLEEVRKGYLFKGRVLRPALVKVAVGSGTPAGGRGAEGGNPGGST